MPASCPHASARKGRHYARVVRTTNNHVFTLAPKPERRSLVSFVSADDAARVSDMINMHVEITRELPFVQHGDVLRLPSTKVPALH